MTGSRIVRGLIDVPATEGAPVTANLIVQVEDVSRADAPSVVVGEQRKSRVALQPGQSIPFEVEVPAEDVDERRTYSVRVHLDMSGSGTVEKGDFVSTQSYPVLTRGHGEEVQIRLKRV
jgi:uncharacterized lipoprotein YbaY